jgi:4-amino-4-deoxy-L-arabinose transferase-like glycosyltransferase
VRGVAFGVAVVVAGLYFVGLGAAPFIDPSEGFHAAVARSMAESGDWATPRVDGVRYFDKPPVLYWLMAASFDAAGVTPAAARVWSALAAVGCAVVTARLGTVLGGARLGLLAGLMVATNLGMFLYGRIVKPDLVFVLFILLAYAGFVLAYRGGGRGALALFYGSLGLAAMTKDVLGALGPLVVVALFLVLTRERPRGWWIPWWGVLVLAAIALPWYFVVEIRNPGFLWYTVVDNHILNFVRQRVFPDEDVPLTALEFVVVTALAFLPWSLAAPSAVARALRGPWTDLTSRVWLLFALWATVVIGFFTLSPFKLPHYGLPAFPALALLVARAWDAAIDGGPGAPRPRTLLVPVLVVFAAVAAAFAAAWLDVLPIPAGALSTLDVATRNQSARGVGAPASPLATWAPILATCTAIFSVATVVLAVAVWRRAAALGVGVVLAAMVAFLPSAGQGMAEYARTRSIRPVTEALAARLRPGDLVVHEGPLENSGSLLLALRQPVRILNGLQSNLAFGATFPDAREVFWDSPRLAVAWTGPRRCFLVSTVRPERSAVRALPPDTVHLVIHAGGRWLYTNVGPGAGEPR